jgi:AraC-like DNA-binding protein
MRPEHSLDAILEFYRELAAVHPSILTEGGGGPEQIGLACGFLGCDALPSSPILTTLPRFLHLRLSAAETPERLKSLLDYAISESSDRRAGSDCVLLRISELMFVEVVRRYLASLNADHPGWLGGLRDPHIGSVLAILHREPGYPWTLETLAKRAGMSRSILAERFLHFIGQPPMQYLAQWRMQVAARLLADDVTAKVAAVALEVGYDSEAAFSRAFKKVVGVPPSAWRARQRRG